MINTLVNEKGKNSYLFRVVSNPPNDAELNTMRDKRLEIERKAKVKTIVNSLIHNNTMEILKTDDMEQVIDNYDSQLPLDIKWMCVDFLNKYVKELEEKQNKMIEEWNKLVKQFDMDDEIEYTESDFEEDV